MDLSDTWLMNAAGWKAVKEGRGLYAAGAVSNVSLNETLVKGRVKVGRKLLLAGLKVHSDSDVDNLCRCPDSLRNGIICSHSIAVALAAIDPANEEDEEDEQKGGSSNKPAVTAKSSVENCIRIAVEPVFTDLWKKNKFPIRISEQAAGSDADASKHSSSQSNEIRKWLLSHCAAGQQTLPPFLVLNQQQAGELLHLSADYPFLSLNKSEERLSVSSLPVRLKVKLSKIEASSDFNARLAGLDSDKQTLLESAKAGETPWIYNQSRKQLWPIRLPQSAESQLSAHQLILAGKGGLKLNELQLANSIAEWSDVFEVDFPKDLQLPRLSVARPEFDIYVNGSLDQIKVSIHAFYGNNELIIGQDIDLKDEQLFPYLDESLDGGRNYLVRNRQSEKTALSELTAAGFTTADQQGVLHLRGRNDILHFHASVIPRLKQKWRRVHLGERYQMATSKIRAIRPTVSFEPGMRGQDWFSCRFESNSLNPASSIPEIEIRRYLATGQNLVRNNDDGTLAVLDRAACEDWFEVIVDCNLKQESGSYCIPSSQREYVESSLISYQQNDDSNLSQSSLGEDELDSSLGDLKDVLRPYQRDGVAWLYRKLLAENGGGALLADEMGLGKTLQTLAVSRVLKSQQPSQAGVGSAPMLVICPTSLIDNWASEIHKFTPEYQTLLMRGSKRSGHFKNMRFADVVITSYALLIRDIESYQKQHFSLIILDEASYIRNPQTQNARCVKKLNSDSRLALTGTPVENSVLDIWSISDFVQPGYLGSRDEFKERYEKPINSGKASVPLHLRFRRRLKPLILRRTKKVVATDLPDKIEHIIYCELTSKQKGLYSSILRESRNKINDAYSSGDERGARVCMLTALLRLRQICCDPRLLDTAKLEKNSARSKSGSESSKSSDSAKLQLLNEMLKEALQGGHRILIFSQFVSMLKLIREELSRADYFDGEIAYLDGASQDRAAQVERFQTDPNVKVFLISLKAGGYGLNLTAADTVMHFDPWWNPAVEAQATDRAHRIGQDNVVSSYKFITRDSVEEKILKLQQRKQDVFDAAIDDQAPMMRGLNTDDLREILEL